MEDGLQIHVVKYIYDKTTKKSFKYGFEMAVLQLVLPCVETCKSGPGCSKPTTSLVNVSLKFQTLISEIFQYFLLK